MSKKEVSAYHKKNLMNLAHLLLFDRSKRLVFDMGSYSSGSSEQDYKETVCKTVGCAIGWNTLLIPKKKNQSYLDYAFEHLIDKTFCEDNPSVNYSNAFSFMFHSEWANIDGEQKSAGIRILYFLENGVPHDKWEPSIYHEWYKKYSSTS